MDCFECRMLLCDSAHVSDMLGGILIPQRMWEMYVGVCIRKLLSCHANGCVYMCLFGILSVVFTCHC